MKYRSVLFVPGHEEKKIKKSYTLSADLIVIDLESTVPDDQKERAKQIIKDCKVDKSKTYIRINNEDDLNFITDEKFLGIFLPFTESRNQLESLDKKLTKIDKNIKEIGFFTNGEPSIEFKDHKKNKLLSNLPFKHF